MNDILQQLGLSDENPGTWLGSNSLEDASAAMIESVNPANGKVIAICSVMDRILQSSEPPKGFLAQEAFSLTNILENRFGEYYAHGGSSQLSAELVARGETGHQRSNQR